MSVLKENARKLGIPDAAQFNAAQVRQINKEFFYDPEKGRYGGYVQDPFLDRIQAADDSSVKALLALMIEEALSYGKSFCDYAQKALETICRRLNIRKVELQRS